MQPLRQHAIIAAPAAMTHCSISLASHRAPNTTNTSFGSPLLLSSTLTRHSCCGLSLVSLAAADNVALMQAFAVVHRLHRPSVAALLANDLVAEWLPTSKFGQPGGMWVTHVLPAVLSVLGVGLKDVLKLPEHILPGAQSFLKVCSEVGNMQVHPLCIAEQQQRHAVLSGLSSAECPISIRHLYQLCYGLDILIMGTSYPGLACTLM